jgi:hypothetical protein
MNTKTRTLIHRAYFTPDQSWRHQLFLIDDFVKHALANNKQHIKITKKRNGALSVYMSPIRQVLFPHLV